MLTSPASGPAPSPNASATRARQIPRATVKSQDWVGLKMPTVLSFFWTVTALILCALIGIVFGSILRRRPPASIPSKPSATNSRCMLACHFDWTTTIP